MSIKFFGQFLLERGELDEADLRQSLDLMEQENSTLGELAVAAGFASQADCRRVHGEQRRKDLPFGELTVQMGVLNSIELEELLQIQRERRLPLAGALVQLGFMEAGRLRLLHDEYKSENAELESSGLMLPGPLCSNRVAELALSMFPRMLQRAGGVDVKIGPGSELDSMSQSVLVASLDVVGTRGVRVTLLANELFGARLAVGLLGSQLAELASELALESLGEFLNIILGNVVALLEEEAIQLRLEPPTFGVLPTQGWMFPLATEGAGAAELVLELSEGLAPST